ncbi:AcrR family transcriptional regulator [Rhodoblastus acidophilus]|uniref:TetR/AcrR family transcriptional regulator n=1 Tax=Rhodoblastus acidophilus TaxID=1074 RepID=UPI00222436E0|nr:TetR/AcrR family transcriptional regulator [Rhodoblastus acidophilus]MCW2318991.1 AcrR family transcriptional regulator [Rhodoblastus acidophilus]
MSMEAPPINRGAQTALRGRKREPVGSGSAREKTMSLSGDTTARVDKILSVAANLFLEHGFSATTTDMIQRGAGMSKATVYQCFPNKEAMFAAVIERACQDLANSLPDIDMSAGPIEASLGELGRAYLEIVIAPTTLALFRVVVAEAPRFPQLGRLLYRSGPRRIISLIGEKLSEAAGNGEIDLQSVGHESAANLFCGLVRAEAQLECLTHPDARPSAAQIDHWVRLAVVTFMRAFGTQDRNVR